MTDAEKKAADITFVEDGEFWYCHLFTIDLHIDIDSEIGIR